MASTAGREGYGYGDNQKLKATGHPVPEPPKESPMRALCDIAIVAFVVFTVWSTGPTIAKQHGTAASMDPVGMMTTTTNLPAQEFDLF
jgi:hypothetical protein